MSEAYVYRDVDVMCDDVRYVTCDPRWPRWHWRLHRYTSWRPARLPRMPQLHAQSPSTGKTITS